jgi:hypothetical protein
MKRRLLWKGLERDLASEISAASNGWIPDLDFSVLFSTSRLRLHFPSLASPEEPHLWPQPLSGISFLRRREWQADEEASTSGSCIIRSR